MKPKLLCILHYTPPAHGASKVGDYIKASKKLEETFECKFIKIKSSNVISDGGKINLIKFYYVILLYFKVLWNLVFFRPDKIYFTASIKKIAFYRDLLVSTLWKSYGLFKEVEVFYHYHTKGINNFVSSSDRNLKLVRFFLNNVNLILLSPMLEKDFAKVKTYKSIKFLPNGVEDPFIDNNFNQMIQNKFHKPIEMLNILYLSNMIKEKGYFKVLELSNKTKENNIHFHFAGGWKNSEDKKEFFDYIQQNDLENKVTFHGFVNGDEKQKLFEKSHFFTFPSRFQNEAFPLSILESLSYGVPAIASDEGSIPYILNDKCGIILNDLGKLLPDTLLDASTKFLNIETSMSCRDRFLKNFTLNLFEDNLIKILNNQLGTK